MKKMISLLAAALLATTFAAGCGKLEHCKDATSKDQCNDAKNFDADKGDKGKCEWKEKNGDKAAHCAVKIENSTVHVPTEAAKAACRLLTDATCETDAGKAPGGDAKSKCKLNTATPKVCEAVAL